MKRILPLLLSVTIVLTQTASAKSKDKSKKVPPGHLRKAAVAESMAYRGARTARSTHSTPSVYSRSTPSTYTRSTPSVYVPSRDSDERRYDRGDRDGARYRVAVPSVEIYRDWDRGRIYTWNDQRYRYADGDWGVYNEAPRTVYRERSSERSEVAIVQAELNRRGYDAGPADGAIGSRTRSAISAFQEENGMAVTGRISDSLLRALGQG